jgi:hypothetical protein
MTRESFDTLLEMADLSVAADDPVRRMVFDHRKAKIADLWNTTEFQECLKPAIRFLQDENTKRSKLQSQIDDLQRQIVSTWERDQRLQQLESDPKVAFDNFRRLARELEGARDTKNAELRELESQLMAAGLMIPPETRGWARSLVAITLAVALAIGLVLLASRWGGAELKSTLSVTYDLGKIIEALLLGSGALIAGVAYAFSTLRRQVAG